MFLRKWLESFTGGYTGNYTKKSVGVERASEKSKISVIVPALNEEAGIGRSIRSIKSNQCTKCKLEVIVVDGGSSDNTVKEARSMGAKVISAERGRGIQQDEGSKSASGDFLLFLHADSELPRCYDALLQKAVQKTPDSTDTKHMWGAFAELTIKDAGPLVKMVEYGIKQRTKFLHLPYGDQCLFFHRDAYRESGGFKHVPFMEDYDMVQSQKKRRIKPLLLDGKVTTSGRRWRDKGIIQTLMLNQLIILSYHMGIPPEQLKKLYYHSSP